MYVGLAFLLMLIKFTAVVVAASEWRLAFNIHASDGHKFGYQEEAWEDNTDVGTDLNAFRADYKNYDVTLETANFIAIVRHQYGVCEAARVWEFHTYGRSLQSYLDRKKSLRVLPTFETYTYSYISKNMLGVDEDPFFSADGRLAFNWEYLDNGVRIGNSGIYRHGGLPGKTNNAADDEFQGLGNNFNIGDRTRSWHDVALVVNGGKTKIQGTDHGTAFSYDGKLLGQYAIFISDAADTFPCKNQQLHIEITKPIQEEYNLMDRNGDGFLNYAEFAFHIADVNIDELLSFEEYEASLKKVFHKHQ